MQFSSDDAIKRARELTGKYAPEAKQAEFSAYYVGQFRMEVFPWGVVGRGLAPSLEVLQSRSHSTWGVLGSTSNRRAGGAEFDRKGRLLSLGVEKSAGDAQATPATVQEALPLARQYAQELFDAPVANLAPTPYVYNSAQRRWVADLGDGREGVTFSSGTPVEWVLADKKRVFVEISHGRLLQASQGPIAGARNAWWYSPAMSDLPGRWELAASRAVGLLGAMCWLGIILFFARQIGRAHV